MKTRMIPSAYPMKPLHLLLALLWMLLASSCQSTCEECSEPSDALSDRLTFIVMSRSAQSEPGMPDASIPEESKIRTLYIYAYDDRHNLPDFYEDPFVNHGQGADGTYAVEMQINGTGLKRFYLIANPPRYIAEKLTPTVSEGELKSMIICLQKPIQRLNQLPQTADGVLNTDKTHTGFPLSNHLTAYVHRQISQENLYLTHDDQATTQPLTLLPLFRALGKISVYAYKESRSGHPSDGGNGTTPPEDLTVTDLEIFNYTCDGYFIPRRTPGGLMDLEAMSKREVKIGIHPVALLNHPIPVTSDYTSQHQLHLTSFYVCQNSFGKAVYGDSQPGMADTEGNRTTKLMISLSDGRKSEISLPHLRRNDHLHIHIGISNNVIKIEFKEWNLNTVTPDWDDGLDPDKHPQPFSANI